MTMKKELFDHADDYLRDLAGENLRDLARNESAEWRWRKAAVRLLLEKGLDKYANHPDLKQLLAEVQKDAEAQKEVEAIVEGSIQSEIPGAHPEEEKVQLLDKVEFHVSKPATLPAHSGSVMKVVEEVDNG